MYFLQMGRLFCKNGASCLSNNLMHLRLSSTHPMVKTNSRFAWLFVLPGLFLVILLGLPLLALFVRAANGEFFTYALSDTALAALKLSLVTSLISVMITVLSGTPLAYILARWNFRGRTALELLIYLPVVLPPSVAGLALLIAFGRQGVFGGWLASFGLTLPFTTTAVILAQTFVSAPLYILAARIGFAGVDPQLEEAAHVEGATQWQLFSKVMIPLAGRALVTGIILAWTRALGEFGATILFAGNLEGKTQTMPLAIYLGFERDINVAVVLSVVLVLVSLVMLGIMRKLDESQPE
jgi:molybdate transport system permease protein